MTTSQTTLVKKYFGENTGESALAQAQSKTIITEINSLEDGDVITIPDSDENFGIQNIRGNNAYAFVCNVKRGKGNEDCLVYLSQFIKFVMAEENGDFKLDDNGRKVVLRSDGSASKAVADTANFKEAWELLKAKGKEGKKIKVGVRTVASMNRNFADGSYSPGKSTLYTFDFV